MYSRRSETITDQCPAEAANREVVTTKCQACRVERRRRVTGHDLSPRDSHFVFRRVGQAIGGPCGAGASRRNNRERLRRSSRLMPKASARGHHHPDVDHKKQNPRDLPGGSVVPISNGASPSPRPWAPPRRDPGRKIDTVLRYFIATPRRWRPAGSLRRPAEPGARPPDAMPPPPTCSLSGECPWWPDRDLGARCHRTTAESRPRL